MITHIVGRLGSGKTLFAVKKILDLLIFGNGEVYTNVRLIDFWDYALGKHVSQGLGSFFKFLLSPMPSLRDFRRYLAFSYVRRYHYFGNIEEAVKAAFDAGEAQEGSRFFVWDEIHLDLNSRMWKTTSQDMIRFFSMSRKLGFDVLMISQLQGAVDRQMRDLADLKYELKNLKHFKPFGIRLFPEIGLLVKKWSNRAGDDSKSVFVGAGFVRYSGFETKMYNTHQLLTDKGLVSPKVWCSASDVADFCCKCNFFEFYCKNARFVSEFKPEGFSYNYPLPTRKVFNIEIEIVRERKAKETESLAAIPPPEIPGAGL